MRLYPKALVLSFIYILASVVPGRLAAQVVVTLPPVQGLNVSLQDVMSPLVFNPGKDESNVFLIGRLSNETGNAEAEFRSQVFTLRQGSQKFDIREIGISAFSFLDAEKRMYYERTGYLPVGSYRFCISVQRVENAVLGEGCVDYKPLFAMPPRLVFPSNESKLKSSPWTLTWLPAAISAAHNDVTYSIQIKEVSEWQSPSEAILSNSSVLEGENITQCLYNVPTSVGNLKPGKKYAWQVRGWSRTALLGESEIWTFNIEPDSIREVKAPNKPYAVLGKEDNTALYYAYGSLNFKFTSQYSVQKLNIVIYDSKLKDVTPDTEILYQELGDNKYSINLLDYSAFRHLDVYTLAVTNEIGEKFYLRFQFLDPYKN
jgi:hypothetical protein